MNRSEAHKAILQRWITLWWTKVGGTQDAPTVPYAIDNRKLAQPADRFAIIEITNISSDQVSMGQVGNRRFERSGFIDVKLYGPRDAGRGELDTLAEYVKEMFEGETIGAIGLDRGVRTYTTNWNELRKDPEYPDKWYLLVRTPYEFHERR